MENYQLVVHKSPDQVEDIRLDKPVLTVGRGDDNDIILKDSSVSRYHARLEAGSGKFRIIDLGSTNGTVLHGVRLSAYQPQSWSREQEVRLGDFTLKLKQAACRIEKTRILAPTDEIELARQMQAQTTTLTIEPARAEAVAGESVVVAANLTNVADEAKEFEFELSGLPSEWVVLSASQASVAAGESAEIQITFAPRGEDLPQSGALPYRLHARSTDREQFVVTEGELAFSAESKFSVTLQSQLPLRSGKVTTIRVANLGTMPSVYTLREEWEDITVEAMHESMMLPTGMWNDWQIIARAKERPLFGLPKQIPFEIGLYDQKKNLETVSGNLSVAPVFSIWLVAGLIMLFIMVLITLQYFGML